MIDDDTLRLSTTDGHPRETVAAAVDQLLARRPSAPRLTVRLGGTSLPAPVVAALVAGLRRLRDVGGAIVVIPETPAVRDALNLHGLDRIFAPPLEPEAQPPNCRPWKAGRAAVAAMAALFAAVLSLAPVDAQSDLSNDTAMILDRVIARNPDLSTFQGRMHVDVNMVSFPFLHEHLDGTTYYKRPASYEVVFDRLPSYARGFDKLYTDAGDPSQWAKHFVITFEGETPYQNRLDLTLHMVQRVRGMIDHETVLVDPNEFTVDQIRYDYYNGGHITISQEFRPVGGNMLLAAQRAEIAIPHVRAIATGRYDSYQTNVALDDSVFSRKN